MVTQKKPITFYPEDNIRDWYESLDEGKRTRVLNEALQRHIDIEAGKIPRLELIEIAIKQLQILLFEVMEMTPLEPWGMKDNIKSFKKDLLQTVDMLDEQATNAQN